MSHTCFFSYDKEASSDTKYVAICRTCGKMQVTMIPLVVESEVSSLPEPYQPRWERSSMPYSIPGMPTIFD